MRICLLGPTYPYRGGIAHYTTLLCRELRRRHTVRFISFSRQYPAWLFPGKTDRDNSGEALREPDVEYLLDSVNPLTWIETARAVVAFDPDLFVLPWWVAFWTPQFWSICRYVKRHSQAKIVFICHNVVEHESSSIKQWCTRRVLGLGDRFIVHSGEDRDNLLALLPRAKVAVNPLPTYADLSGQRVEREAARYQLELHPETPMILFFGFVREYKGLHVLLDALPRIRERIGATLLIVGEFWKDKAEYLARIERLGIGDHVRIIDRYVPNEEIPLYFGAADMVACPYLSATGSAVVQLALGFGRPVAATRVGCLPEVIEDGVSGRVVPPGNSEALADAVADMLDPAHRPNYFAGVERARTTFSWERMATTIVALNSDYDQDNGQ